MRKYYGNAEIRDLMENRSKASLHGGAQKAQEVPAQPQGSGQRFESLVASLFSGRDQAQPVYAEANTTGEKK